MFLVCGFVYLIGVCWFRFEWLVLVVLCVGCGCVIIVFVFLCYYTRLLGWLVVWLFGLVGLIGLGFALCVIVLFGCGWVVLVWGLVGFVGFWGLLV